MKKCMFPLMLTALFFYSVATAEESEKIEKVELSEPSTPLYQDQDGLETIQIKGLIQEATSDKKWFRIATTYSTKEEWTDKLTLEYYVLFPGATNVFKGVVNYIDIPKGRAHLSEMYMHFNSYARNYKKGTISYAVVCLVGGKEVSVNTNKRSPEGWWKEMPVSPCGLLDRNMTPFVVFNVEKFESQDHCSR